MIPFEFEYYKPSSLEETTELYKQLLDAGKEVKFYGGGTEIISMARANNLQFSAVIDLKGIPECNRLDLNQDNLVIGSMVPLSQITESGLYPLLGETAARVADHTMQCKITLGGNLCGTILCRETALPLMLNDASVMISGLSGTSEVPFSHIFDGSVRLESGCFLVQIIIKKSYLALPYVHVKKTRNEKIDYPLLTVTAIKKDKVIKAAISGASYKPFVIPEEAGLNQTHIPARSRVAEAVWNIKYNLISDLTGSADYRAFVLTNILTQTLQNLGGS